MALTSSPESLLPVLKPKDYRGFLNRRRCRWNMLVHRALVRWGDEGTMDTHLKIPGDGNKQPGRMYLNEALSYLLAKARGLPVPAYAGFMVLSAEQLSEAYSIKITQPALAWATSTEPEQCLQLHGEAARIAFNEEVLAWPDAARTAAFDQWIGNTDRNESNLLRRGLRDFVLIDHEYALTSPYWLADFLLASHADDHTNLLQQTLNGAPLHSADCGKALGNAMLEETHGHLATLQIYAAELQHWIERLAKSPEDRWAAALFLGQRARIGPATVRRHYQLLL